jgi:hypothetical protein
MTCLSLLPSRANDLPSVVARTQHPGKHSARKLHTMYSALADAVLILHTSVAGFVVVGLPLVVYGNVKGWHWVNQLGLRLTHLAAIAVVVLESWVGLACPLTTLESWLRIQAGQNGNDSGFIEYWVGALLFYNAPSWTFTLAYSLFGIAVAATWWLYPPRLPPRPPLRSSPSQKSLTK